MGEAILIKAGGMQKDLTEESTATNAYLLTSGYFVAPKSGNYYVTCVGGGGSGGATGGGSVVSNPAWSSSAYSYESNRSWSYSSGGNITYVSNSTFKIYENDLYAGPYAPGGGGGSGYFNSATVYLNAGQTVEVGIGIGSSTGTGGTTSFGTYLAANGGKAGSTPYCWTCKSVFDDFYEGWIREQGWIGGNGGAGGVAGSNGNAGAMGSKTNGGKLYFNNSGGQSAVSSSATSYGVLSYGDGGYGGYVIDLQLSFFNGAISSVNLAQPGAGNNGICIIKYAD